MRLALLLLWGTIPAAVKNLLLQTAFMDSLCFNLGPGHRMQKAIAFTVSLIRTAICELTM